MEKIGLLIDSTSYTRKKLYNYEFVKSAYLKVIIGNQEYSESQLTKEDMEKYLAETHKMLTSQPSPMDFVNLYNEFKNEGYTHVLVVVISEKISGTYQSALIGKSMLEDMDMDISIHSPQSASFGIANGLEILANKIQSGTSYQEILDLYYKIFKEPLVSFTLGDLMHLYKGGRLNKVQALVGKVLRIKPIIEMVEGKLELVKKTRSNIACYDYFVEKIKYYIDRYDSVHVDIISLHMDDWAQKIETYIKENHPKVIIHNTDYVSPVFYVHLGNNGFGIAIVGY
jgi:DegV family protein with EDD domain